METDIGNQASNFPIIATTFRHKYGTASQPILVECSDGLEWIVKGQQNGKMIYNDYVIGNIGCLLKAPIPRVDLVHVPEEMIRNCAAMGHMQPGISHGSLFIKDCTDRTGIQPDYLNNENEPRFASLHVFFSWMHSNDQQWIYEKLPPNRVYSVDHGHFFPGGPNWTIDSLRVAQLPQFVNEFQTFRINPMHYEEPLSYLESLKAEQISEIVIDMPPKEWSCSIEERFELLDFLLKRIPLVLKLFKEGR